MTEILSSLAFVFPGQGSQQLGMLADLKSLFPVVEQTFEQASSTLGYDLWALIKNGPEEKLNQTEFTQPALLASSVALWRVWQHKEGPRPAYMAGHSLGEYSALVCSGALDFEQGLRLVAKRGALMQSAVPKGQGAMAAILGLDNEKILEVCQEVASDQVVSPVNFNAIGQTVIAGHAEAVNRAIKALKAQGAKRAMLLGVSVPSHCALMKEAATEFTAALRETTFTPPQTPVVHNVDVSEHASEVEIVKVLEQQLYSPVRWLETIQYLKTKNIETIIECGPGTVLAGLVKRIDKSIQGVAFNSEASFSKALTFFDKDVAGL